MSDPSFTFAVTFPLIAKAISDVYERTGDWVSRNEAVTQMLSDSGTSVVVADAALKQGRPGEDADIAGNMVAWWSKDWTENTNPYRGAFERLTVGRTYQYRPVLVPATPSVPVGNTSSERVRASGGQGTGLSTAERSAVELQAMATAHVWLTNRFPGGTITDTSANRPYDYLVDASDGAYYVEVKGTTGSDSTVIVTVGEVNHAITHHGRCILVVVKDIVLTRTDAPTASGGSLEAFDPWEPGKGKLLPRSYTHTPRH